MRFPCTATTDPGTADGRCRCPGCKANEAIRAADRLAEWCAAPTDGDDPYRRNDEHLFDADLFDADVRAVVSAYLIMVRDRLGT